VIRARRRALGEGELDALKAWQHAINTISDYRTRIREAERLFKSRNRLKNKVFGRVRRVLGAMRPGRLYCMYCETSRGRHIDHYHPKALYPKRVFVWRNYLYLCDGCNLRKGDRFPLRLADGMVKHLPDGDAPPPRGEPMLINPRHEDPMRLLWLDLGTFLYVPDITATQAEQLRASETIKLLDLNETALVRVRKDAFEWFRDALQVHLAERNCDPISSIRRAERIRSSQNLTVWEEMKRQRALHPSLDALFTKASEALRW
jgi:uncharacterized protein (TIGR02646 family)